MILKNRYHKLFPGAVTSLRFYPMCRHKLACHSFIVAGGTDRHPGSEMEGEASLTALAEARVSYSILYQFLEPQFPPCDVQRVRIHLHTQQVELQGSDFREFREPESFIMGNKQDCPLLLKEHYLYYTVQ